MTTEFWINNQDDINELRSFIKDEGFSVVICGEDEEGNEILEFGDYRVYKPKQYQLEEPEQKYDPLIFGKDQTEKITNITVNDNDTVDIYKNDGTHKTLGYKKWAIGSTYTNGSRKYSGYQYYKYMKELSEYEYEELKSKWNPSVWMARTPEEGFMLKHGYTYYKGLKVSDVSLYSLDIESTSLRKDVPEAQVVLMSRTYRDRFGKLTKKMFDMFDYKNSDEMFHDITEDIKSCDPDIILGHNVLGFDLPYMAEQSPSDLYWGRNGSEVKFDTKASKKRKDGSQSYEFFNARIHGREVIDTLFMSISYDTQRNFPSYGLKAIEKYLNLVDDNRIEWDFKKWPVKRLVEERTKGTKDGINAWNLFREYCADDTASPIKMFDIMAPSFFYLAQSVPKTMQQMINEATGSQIDSVMIRSYLQDGHSIPRSSKTKKFKGAVSMGVPGTYEHVLKFDVASLYPSIMLEYNIYDKKKDPNRHMLQLLEYFRDERLTNKKLAKDLGEKYYDDLQNAQKIFINSLYGFMGANFLLYNVPDGAEEVTLRGREINLKGIEWATGHTLKEEVKKITNKGKEDENTEYHWVVGDKVCEGKGYDLVNTDTDSFSMTNGEKPTKETFQELLDDLNSLYSDMIVWEDDGLFDKVIVVAAKNYVLVRDGKVKYKGSSLTDQKKEPILIQFQHDLIDILLTDFKYKILVREEALLECFNRYCKKALDIKDINKWVTKKTVTDKMVSGSTVAGAKAYDACLEAIEKDVIKGVQEGDKIWVYQYIKDEKVQQVIKDEPQFCKYTKKEYEALGLEKKPQTESCEHKETLFCNKCNPHLYYPKMIEQSGLRFPELFDGTYDKWHYVKRVYATLDTLSNIIDMAKYPKYHNKAQRKLLEKL